MKHQRNVEGLRESAQKKRQQAFEKTEQGIRQLLKSGRPVNFETVAEVSGVSKAWLYREAQIKERIERLRAQGSEKIPAAKTKASDASKEAINKTLKERIKRLEAEIRGLRDHIEVITGQNYVLEEENARLKKQLIVTNHSSRLVDRANFVSTSESASLNLSQNIRTELEHLKVKVNSTLLRLINQTPEENVLRAIEALKQQTQGRFIKNPVGFLVEAIRGEWNCNEEQESKIENGLFSEWYSIAQSLNLVIASHSVNGVMYVYTQEGKAVPFAEMLSEHPLDKLRQLI